LEGDNIPPLNISLTDPVAGTSFFDGASPLRATQVTALSKTRTLVCLFAPERLWLCSRRMKHPIRLQVWFVPVVVCFGAWCVCLGAADADTEMLPRVRRVLFLGDSITYSGQYVEFVEAYFVTRFPGRQIEFLNLGLPSETVSGLSEPGHADGQFPRPDLHERLARVLEKTRPDVVIACYGMNDGIYLPFAEERFEKFRNGLLRLRERVTAAGAKIIHVTPPTFDEVRGKSPGYGNTLDRYADWMLAQRAAGWDVVDLHGPMNHFLAERRKADPNFFLAGDGVHADETGHWIVAKQILRHLGAKGLAEMENAKAMVGVHPNGEPLLKVIQQKQRLLKDAWLTDTGHKRPGMNEGLPLAEAQEKAAELEQQIRELARAAHQ
jgi:lysophospholipase L1-like esterase